MSGWFMSSYINMQNFRYNKYLCKFRGPNMQNFKCKDLIININII
jgi:hypothetical protein